MADSILRLKVESQEYDNKLKQATNGLTRYIDECRKAGGTLEVVEKETLDYVRAIGQMETTSRTATGKLAEMKKTFTELSAQYKQMADAEKQSPFGKALAASLDQLKGRINESKSQLDDINNSINGGGGLTGALDNMLGKVGLNVEGLMKFGGAAGAATTALKVAKDAFFASETSLDEWGRTVQSTQSLYQGFLSALNNSDISGFLSRMNEIVSAARDAYNAMDELGTFSAFQQRNVAKGRAGYAQALDEYRLNPTADNKQKLQQANQKVMNDLRESHDKTEAAYQAALRQIATERISGKGMQDAFVKMFSEGNYGDLQAAKSSYKTGRGLNSGAQYYYGDRVYDGRVQDRTTGKWRDMSDTEKQQFEFARALSQVNDSQIKEVQALGAQSVAITEQIYQQDRAYNRLAGNNAPLRRKGGKGGKTGTNINYATDSIMAQQAEVSRLTKLWQSAGAVVRDDYKAQLDEAQYLLDRMTGKEKFDPTKMGPIADLTGRVPVPDFGVDMKRGKNGNWYDATAPVAPDTIKFSDSLAKRMEYEEKQRTKDIEKPEANLLENTQDLIGGLSSVASGLSQMGIELPDGVQKVLGGMQGLMSVIQGVQTILNIFTTTTTSAQMASLAANSSMLVANTAALSALTGAIATNTVTNLIPFASGGVVKAASGYRVPGRTFSGDVIPARLNAGELVLNQAQAGVIANALQDRDFSGGSGMMQPYVDGEKIFLGMNNTSKRMGRGEIVTTGTLRRLGLI